MGWDVPARVASETKSFRSLPTIRPGAALSNVTAPTLLIVGGLDTQVIALNEQAKARMRGAVSLEIVPGASHLFEEPGTLDVVAARAGEWFVAHLAPALRARG